MKQRGGCGELPTALAAGRKPAPRAGVPPALTCAGRARLLPTPSERSASTSQNSACEDCLCARLIVAALLASLEQRGAGPPKESSDTVLPQPRPRSSTAVTGSPEAHVLSTEVLNDLWPLKPNIDIIITSTPGFSKLPALGHG